MNEWSKLVCGEARKKCAGLGLTSPYLNQPSGLAPSITSRR